MHRTRPFPAPHHASRLPPFGAVGWLVSVLSEPGRQRDFQPESGVFPPEPRQGIGPPEAGIKAARTRKPAGHTASWVGAAIWNRGGT
ncbi:hypothetical protein [Albidovulum sp.]|uniref:hypothetical protein n=1 Tax=Albidovulum sp. TaxID=1872424 RepID=UPI0039B8EA93